MKQWMSDFTDSIFCSWGAYDRNQFRRDGEFHQIAYPFDSGHLNLKEEVNRMLSRKPMGIGEALRRLGMNFEGSPHRGLDDARNIARIVRRVFFKR